MGTLLLLVIDTALAILIYKAVKRYRLHRSDVRYLRIYDGVHSLESKVRQLEELEQLIISIETAKAHRLRGVTITLPDSIVSTDHTHQLLINGHDNNSKVLLQLVLSERERLRNELVKDIDTLHRYGTTCTTRSIQQYTHLNRLTGESDSNEE